MVNTDTTTKAIAILLVAGATGLAGTEAAPTRRGGGTTRGERKVYSAEEIKQMAIDGIHDRLLAEQECPVEKYYDGEGCRPCTEVCQPQLDRFCTQICPDWAQAQERAKLERELRAEYGKMSVACYVIAGAFAVIVVCFVAYVIHVRRFGGLERVARDNEEEEEEGEGNKPAQSCETSFSDLLDSRRDVNAIRDEGPRDQRPQDQDNDEAQAEEPFAGQDNQAQDEAPQADMALAEEPLIPQGDPADMPRRNPNNVQPTGDGSE